MDEKPRINDMGEYLVKAAPVVPVVNTGIAERAIGKLVDLALLKNPGDHGEEDLAGDTFQALWQTETSLVTDAPPERAANHALMDWMLSKGEFEANKSELVGNLPACLTTASLLWQSLVTDEALKDALDRQLQADMARKEAQENFEAAAQAAADGDQQAYDQFMADATDAQSEANLLGQKAAQAVQKVSKNPLADGKMASAIEAAAGEGKAVAAFCRGWGIGEGGNLSVGDATEIIRAAKSHSGILRRIAALLGRLKGVAMRASEDARMSYTGTVTEPALTKDITKLFPTELAYLSQKAPAPLRLSRMYSLLAGGGLLGWKPKTEAKKSGAYLAYIDESGSMSGTPVETAKAIALAVAQATKDDQVAERYYEIWSFAYERRHMHSVNSDQDWKAHLKWASTFIDGGNTDFNSTLMHAIERIEELSRSGVKGVDVQFITDGLAYVNDETKDAWRKLSDKLGTRLIVIFIGHFPNKGISEIANTVIEFKNADLFSKNADKLAATLASSVTKGALE